MLHHFNTELVSDGSSAVYLRRSLDRIGSPPPEGWDGVHVMKDKEGDSDG